MRSGRPPKIGKSCWKSANPPILPKWENLQNPMLTFTKSAINLIRTRTGDARLTFAPAKAIPNLPPLGAMIETPAAALTVGQIGRYADFFSVGTNDLIQYTLVAGRDDATVSDYYDETHSSMLRLLGIIIGEASGKPVTICGEMAAREEVIPTLLEIGFHTLSISPPLIPTTKELIRSVDTRNLHGQR